MLESDDNSLYDYKKVAADYDDPSKQHQWDAPALLFNFLSGFVRKGTKSSDMFLSACALTKLPRRRDYIILVYIEEQSSALQMATKNG